MVGNEIHTSFVNAVGAEALREVQAMQAYTLTQGLTLFKYIQ